MIKVQDAILNNTPFAYSCNVYKSYNIPVLEDTNTGKCKEHIKQILDMTKNPLSQNIDVLIPKLDNRTNAEKQKLKNMKRFFGKRHKTACEDDQQKHLSPLKKTLNSDAKNVCIHETPISNYVHELIEVEELHVALLEEFVARFMAPIKESIDNPNKVAILDLYTFKRIFRNTKKLLELHQRFYNSLKQYQHGSTTASFGEILLEHIDDFNCYKTFYLGHTDAIKYHKQNIKKNNLYRKLAASVTFEGNLYAENAFERFFGLPMKYTSLLKSIAQKMQPDDADMENIQCVMEKLDHINQRHYGDSFVLSLYYHIRDPPDSLIRPRELISYFDASELALNGEYIRPVIILIFTDKIIVMKRKNPNLRGKDLLDNIQDKLIDQPSNNVVMQKIKEVYNGYPLEFKGWVDLNYVELFNGLDGREDTFFLRTNLPEQDNDDIEKEYEDYFRKNDRLYSLKPNQSTSGSILSYIEDKKQLISIFQKQRAISKLEGTESVLYIENKFKIPAYTHFYNEESYLKVKNKNHILVIYVEEEYPVNKIDINSLIDDNVWIVMLLRNFTAGGCKLTIRARTNLVPFHQSNRNLKYECLTQPKADTNGQLDFIDTLWNSIFYYERQLRASRNFSKIHDCTLRGRNKSRSRSKSLSRIASNISLGKLLSRSRSSSPTRPSSLDSMERKGEYEQSNVTNPVIHIATIKNHMETNTYHQQTSAENLLSKSATSSRVFHNTHGELSTQPQTENYRRLSEIFDSGLTSYFDQLPSTAHYRHSTSTPLGGRYSHHQTVGSSRNRDSLDTMLFSKTPELISSSRCNSNDSSATFCDQKTLSSHPSVYDDTSIESQSYYSHTASSKTSVNSYFGLEPQEKYRSYRGDSNDEKLMAMIDKSKRDTTLTRSRFNNAYYSRSPQPMVHQSAYRDNRRSSAVYSSINNDNINEMIEELIQSQSPHGQKASKSTSLYDSYSQNFRIVK